MLHLLAYMTADPPPTPPTPEEMIADRTGKALAICVVAIVIVFAVKKLASSPKAKPARPDKPPS